MQPEEEVSVEVCEGRAPAPHRSQAPVPLHCHLRYSAFNLENEEFNRKLHKLNATNIQSFYSSECALFACFGLAVLAVVLPCSSCSSCLPASLPSLPCSRCCLSWSPCWQCLPCCCLVPCSSRMVITCLTKYLKG